MKKKLLKIIDNCLDCYNLRYKDEIYSCKYYCSKIGLSNPVIVSEGVPLKEEFKIPNFCPLENEEWIMNYTYYDWLSEIWYHLQKRGTLRFCVNSLCYYLKRKKDKTDGGREMIIPHDVVEKLLKDKCLRISKVTARKRYYKLTKKGKSM